MIDEFARECEGVERDRDIDIRMLVWTLTVGFAVGGETRSTAGYRRAYNAATNQSIVASSFYDRFTEQFHDLLDNCSTTHWTKSLFPSTFPPSSIGSET